MAGNLQQRLDSLKGKMQLIVERYAKLTDYARRADATIADLRATIDSPAKEIALLNQEIEYLKVVSVLTPKREDVQQSRAMLAELLRDIDKCINELSE